jgi:hypothetical protein
MTNVRVERFLRGLRKKARFAIEGPGGRFSTPWPTWEHGDTIYIVGRNLGGVLKVSLHPVGGYRLAFTKEFHPQAKKRTRSFATRDLVVWPKPDLSGNEAALIASLCFPTDHLRSGPPPASARKQYLLLQAPAPGRATNVGFFLSRAPAEALETAFLQIGKPLFRWDFDDATSISVVAWESGFDPSVLPNKINPRAILPLLGSREIRPERYHDLTAMIWNEPGSGVPLQIIELGGLSLRAGEEVSSGADP